MKIDSIKNGYVIDHIQPGTGMELYKVLELENLTCSVALIKNAPSAKMGKKDIIKIDALIDLNLDVLAYYDPGITVNVVRNGILENKFHPNLPLELVGVVTCKNPRCISSVEQDLPQIFRLTDEQTRTYRCIYCETAVKRS